MSTPSRAARQPPPQVGAAGAPAAPRGRAATLIGWGAVAAIFALLLWHVPLAQIGAALRAADPLLLLAAAAVGLFGESVVAAAKLRSMLALLGTAVSLWEAMVLRMGTYPARQLLPLKSGELLRVGYLRRCHGVSLARAALLALLDAASDAVALGVFLAFGLALQERMAALVLALAALGCAAAFVAARRPALLAPLRRRLADLGAAMRVDRFTAWRHGAALAAWTFFLVLLDLLAYGLVLRAFDLAIPAAAMLVFVPLVVVATSLPLTPLGLGTREAAMTLLLAPYGDPADLLAAALTASAVVRLVPLLAGIAFMRPLLHRLWSAPR